ncbi:MAG: Wzz/FepE/Etk N-terminal domain-containing protein [Desulfotomaculaceae bacterium]|nr:Wzz/FepE/Etk N-terminal domain-containing protein [Desulfotomaculaceae bacterium]
MDEPHNSAEPHINMVELRSLSNIVKKRFPLITAVTMLMLLIVGLISFFVLPPIYEAKTTVLVTNATQSLPSGNQMDDFDSFLKGISSITALTMNSCIQQAKSEILMLRIIEKLNLHERGYTIRSLTKQISVESPKDSNILSITVRDKDPQLALAMANGLSHELIALNKEKNLEIMDNSIQAMEKQAELVNQRLAEAATEKETEIFINTFTSLKEKIVQASIARSIESESGQFIEFSPAQYPNQPVKPNKILNMVIALFLGVMVGFSLALILEIYEAQHIQPPESEQVREIDTNQN